MFHIKRLGSKLVFYYALLIVGILGSIFIFFSSNYSRFIFREKENVYEQKLDIVSEQLNNAITRIYNLHSEALSSPGLQELVNGTRQADPQTKEALESLRSQFAGVRALYLYDKEGTLLESAANSLESSPEFPGLPDFRDSKAYRRFSVQDDMLVYYGAFYLSRDARYTYEAYLAVVIDPDRMFYNLNLKSDEAFDGLYLFGSEGLIMRHGISLAEDLIRNAGQADQVRNGSNKYVIFRRKNSEYAEWELTALVNYDLYGKEVWNLTLLLFVLALLSMCLIILISSFISHRIIQPILLVNKAMAQVEKGAFPEPLISRSADETDDLIQGFNHMVKSLKELREDIAKKQEERREYEVEKVRTQLKLLQSQVNPHFIHNTLNTLKYMALTAGNTELAGTITSFNALLRASISTDMEFTTVEEECRCLMDYLNIQQKRCAPRQINCTTHIDEEASQALLPRLILQPLVENSLFHGILPMEEGVGYIRVFCFVENKFLHIYVSDNGVGIPEETLKKLNAGELRVTNQYSHIGLNNVKERLNLMYRTDCKFIITSEQLSGTTIYFRVPYEEEL